jgi:hypothetical protein
MGNHKRGVYLKSTHTVRVVGSCGFTRLYRAHAIDWTLSGHLRGDWTAREKGCS